MSHFKQVCSKCGTIVAQCRCPSQDKVTISVVCARCENPGAAPDTALAPCPPSMGAAGTFRGRTVEVSLVDQGPDGLHTVRLVRLSATVNASVHRWEVYDEEPRWFITLRPSSLRRHGHVVPVDLYRVEVQAASFQAALDKLDEKLQSVSRWLEELK